MPGLQEVGEHACRPRALETLSPNQILEPIERKVVKRAFEGKALHYSPRHPFYRKVATLQRDVRMTD